MPRQIVYALAPIAIVVAAVGVGASATFPVTGRGLQDAGDTVVRLAGAPRHTRVAELIPEITIGGADGDNEHFINANSTVLVTRNRTVWVAEGGLGRAVPPSIRRFNADGNYIRQVSRSGMGPGEYQSPSGLAEMPDGRVILRDAAIHNRLTVYRSDGRLDTTWTFFPALLGGRAAPTVDPAGNVLVNIAPSVFAQGAARGYVRISGTGRIVDTIPDPTPPGAFPSGMAVVPPFWPRRGAVLGPRGHFAMYDASRYEINVRVPRVAARPGRPATWRPGDQVLSIRKDEPPIMLSDAEYRDWQTYFDAALRVNGDARVGEVRRVKPPIRGVRFGDDGRIWVHVSMPSERYDPPHRRRPPGDPVRPVVRWREPAVFDVYEPEGDYIGRVRFPYDLSPLTLYASPVSMRGDVVWCTQWTEDDVVILRRYRIAW